MAFKVPEDTEFPSLYDTVCRSGDDQPSECSSQAGLSFPGPNPDMNCATSGASTGAVCTRDCLVPCGYDRLGLKSCACEGGVYVACPCTKPSSYEGELTAPSCDTIEASGGSNDITVLDPDGVDPIPCDEPWQECIGFDPDELGNPNRGCVCLPQRGPDLQFFVPFRAAWDCAATNRWFSLEVP